MKKIFIIDALNYLFRSYFAIKGMTNKKGDATNALFGFVRSIEKLIKEFEPEHIVCVFDGPNNKKSRTDIYKEYKGHREKMPDDLFCQIDISKKYCRYRGIQIIEVSGVEADDVIGSIAKWSAEKNICTYICSSDKDLCQLVDNNVKILQTYKDNLIIDSSEVEKIYGVRPNQIVDYLAITGDASDNIPGIKGFGPKTAAKLLSQYGSLANILKNPDQIENKKYSEKIKAESEIAKMSYQLATIQLDVPFTKKDDFFELKTIDYTGLINLFQEMNFTSLIKEFEKKPSIIDGNVKELYQLVDDEKSLTNLLSLLYKCKEVAIDIETTSLSPLEARIVGIGLTSEEKMGSYIPFNGALGEKNATLIIAPFLRDKAIRFVGHDVKYDMHVLANHGLTISNISFDTMMASYLLNSNARDHNLNKLALEKFAFTKTSIDSLLGSKMVKKQTPMSEVAIESVKNYCCENVDYIMRLKNIFTKELRQNNLYDLFQNIEMPIINILFKMERHGIYVDTDRLALLSKEFHQKIEFLKIEIFAIAKKEINLNSTQQLSALLFGDLKIKSPKAKKNDFYSTKATILESLIDSHPIVPLILEYRTLEKLRSTYVDALAIGINEKTKRIHCTFNQSVTATGRLSSANPNLQNIPVRGVDGKKIREVFIPEKKGWSYLGADYSQIELRILAHLSEEPALIKAFKNDEDIHKICASEIFGVSLEDVTEEMRFRAKAVNFGVIYGQQAFGLSQGLGITIKDAALFIDMYFKKHQKVKKFIEKCQMDAIRNGKATSLFGRERLLPDILNKNMMIKSQGMRLAVNTPIQGTQSDIIKLAMIELDKKFLKERLKSFLILQIHDELIFECPDEEIDNCKIVVTSIMENVVKLKVPLKVDISIGKNWGEC